jgi:hypothetical protein
MTVTTFSIRDLTPRIAGEIRAEERDLRSVRAGTRTNLAGEELST